MIPANVKNIIFDLGGVIIRLDQPRTDRALAELAGISPEAFRKLAAGKQSFFQSFERGEIEDNAFLEELRQLLQTKVSISTLQHAWNAMLLELPVENVRMLRELGSQYRLFMLSNTNEIHTAEVHRRVKAVSGLENFNSLFEEVFYSQRIGARKPEEKAFRLILEKYHLSAAETLFVDDNLENIKGAEGLGIQTWHYPLNQLLEHAINGGKKQE
ncbi:HAD family hydrolase [Nafulsella turpanensis]|uniref:HAD family hydrolase n=1 Tax=Nafulsella turpanensis TaxID=1265690 RepID=UPI00034BC66C|nr:HAD family phosphatase [Nafulsella turpanensis]